MPVRLPPEQVRGPTSRVSWLGVALAVMFAAVAGVSLRALHGSRATASASPGRDVAVPLGRGTPAATTDASAGAPLASPPPRVPANVLSDADETLPFDIVDDRDGTAVLLDERFLELVGVTWAPWGRSAPLADPRSLRPERVTPQGDGRVRHALPSLARDLASYPDGWYAASLRASARLRDRADAPEVEMARWIYFRVDGGSVTRIDIHAYTDALSPRQPALDRFGNPVWLRSMARVPGERGPDEPYTEAIRIDDPADIVPLVAGDEREEP